LKRTNQVKFNPDKTHLLVFNKTTSEEDVIYLCGETAWSTATLRILNTLKKEKKFYSVLKINKIKNYLFQFVAKLYFKKKIDA